MELAQMLADPEAGSLSGLVDLERYRLESPESPELKSLVAHCREQLATEGAVILPGFLTPDALKNAAREIAGAAEHVPLRRQSSSVYARSDLEKSYSRDDPRCKRLEYFAGHVTRDMMAPYTTAHRLYVSPHFKRFIGAAVAEQNIFEYADPLAGLIATVLPPGGQYPWHYDTNEFVVTIMTQQPERGGEFQYFKDLRTPGDENLKGLSGALEGVHNSQMRTIDLRPGDLQLFLGRYSLHQVAPVQGDTTRHVIVLSYANRPGVIGPVDRTRAVYGRVTEAHLVAEGLAAGDGLIL